VVLVPIRHHQNDLGFLKLRFGTRRSVVQIHSPRPLPNPAFHWFKLPFDFQLRLRFVDQRGPIQNPSRCVQPIPGGTLRHLLALNIGPPLLPVRVPSNSVPGPSEHHSSSATSGGSAGRRGTPRLFEREAPAIRFAVVVVSLALLRRDTHWCRTRTSEVLLREPRERPRPGQHWNSVFISSQRPIACAMANGPDGSGSLFDKSLHPKSFHMGPSSKHEFPWDTYNHFHSPISTPVPIHTPTPLL